MQVYTVIYECRIKGAIGEFSPFEVEVVTPNGADTSTVYEIARKHIAKCGLEPRFPINQTFKGEI